MIDATTPILSLPPELLGPIFTMVPDCKGKGSFLCTCKTFKEAADYYCCDAEQRALVKAVVRRELTPEEARQSGVPSDEQFNTSSEQMPAEEKNPEVEIALQNFYAALKNRCIPFNFDVSNCNEFMFVYEGLIHKFNLAPGLTLNLKMQTTFEALGKKIYTDMVWTFARQPAECITIQSYCKKAEDIHRYFEGNSIIAIEASLRQALIAEYDQAFKALSNEFLDRSVDNPRILEIQKQLKLKLETERQAIEAELLALRGPTGWNGTVHEAHEQLQYRRMALDTAKREFICEYNACFNSPITSRLKTLLAIPCADAPNALQVAKNNFVAKYAEYSAAKKELDTLNTKLSELARFDLSGHVIDGKLAHVQADLANLRSVARAEATRIGLFYSELQMPVSEGNKQVCYDAIHTIIAGSRFSA